MIKRLLKIKSKHTYMGKDNKEHYYYNLFVETDNGKRIQIKCAFEKDINVLDSHAEYIG